MIQHVALEVPRARVREEIAFWELLGLVVVDAPGSLASRSDWLQDPAGRQVHLLHSDAPVAPPDGHVALCPPDLEAVVARLEAAGHPVREREAHWGARRVFASSPCGHRVELMTAPPPGASAG